MTIVQDKFEKAARLHARVGGLPDLALLVEPAPSAGSVQHNARDLVLTNADAFGRALTSQEGRA